MKKEAKPHVNFTLKNNSIYLIREFADFAKIPISITTENIFQMFEWDKEDPNHTDYRSSNLELWVNFREIDFSEWIDFTEKPLPPPPKKSKLPTVLFSFLSLIVLALVIVLIVQVINGK